MVFGEGRFLLHTIMCSVRMVDGNIDESAQCILFARSPNLINKSTKQAMPINQTPESPGARSRKLSRSLHHFRHSLEWENNRDKHAQMSARPSGSHNPPILFGGISYFFIGNKSLGSELC